MDTVPAEVVALLRAAGCVFAEDEAELLRSAARSHAELSTMVARRVAGEPIERIVGWAEFCGLRIAVDPGVFVPRRRSEFLVERAATQLRPAAIVVDLCCGSGAIGAALAARADRVRVYAVDIDPAAVSCARRNLRSVGGRALLGDLYAALPARLRGRIDVLVASVPYVPTDRLDLLPAEARLFESRVALDGGPDGLTVLRRVAAGAAGWLAPDGRLLLETSRDQAAAALDAIRRGGLDAAATTDDRRDATVLTGGRRP